MILLQILKFFVNSFHVTSKSLSDFVVRIYRHLKMRLMVVVAHTIVLH